MEKNAFAKAVVTYPEVLLICSSNSVTLDTAAAMAVPTHLGLWWFIDTLRSLLVSAGTRLMN